MSNPQIQKNNHTPIASMQDVSPFDVADYLQMAAASHKSMSLELDGLEEATGRMLVGHIVVVEGMLWTAAAHAISDPHITVGVPALQKLLWLQQPHIHCHLVGSQDQNMPRTITRSIEELLLDLARQYDESHAQEAHIPEAHTQETHTQEAHIPEPELEIQVIEAPDAALQLWRERGLELLLQKKYNEAYQAFQQAQNYGEDSVVNANLRRLQMMGYPKGEL